MSALGHILIFGLSVFVLLLCVMIDQEEEADDGWRLPGE